MEQCKRCTVTENHKFASNEVDVSSDWTRSHSTPTAFFTADRHASHRTAENIVFRGPNYLSYSYSG